MSDTPPVASRQGITSWCGGILPALGGALVYRALLVLLMMWWIGLMHPSGPPPGHRFYHGVGRVETSAGDLFIKWDSYHYLNIVNFGYTVVEGVMSNTAFPPAYPYLVKGLVGLGMDAATAGVVLSGVCFAIALVFAHMYGRIVGDDRTARHLVLFLCVFPSAWVFQMVYSDSLFCAALFGFLVLYLRGHYVAAGVVGFLLPVTRIAGLAVLPAILADAAITWHREKRFPLQKALCATGIFAGLAFTCVIFASAVDDPFVFLRQLSGWSTEAGYAGSVCPLLSSIVADYSSKPYVRLLVPMLAIYVVAAVLLVIKRRDLPSFFALAYLLLLSRHTYASQLRYLLPLLPVHAFLVAHLVRRKWIGPALAILAGMQVVLTRLYIDWRFIT